MNQVYKLYRKFTTYFDYLFSYDYDELFSKRGNKHFRTNLGVCRKYLCYSDPRSGIPLHNLKLYGIIIIFIILENSLDFKMMELQINSPSKVQETVRSDISIPWFAAHITRILPQLFFLYSGHAVMIASSLGDFK